MNATRNTISKILSALESLSLEGLGIEAAKKDLQDALDILGYKPTPLPNKNGKYIYHENGYNTISD